MPVIRAAWLSRSFIARLRRTYLDYSQEITSLELKVPKPRKNPRHGAPYGRPAVPPRAEPPAPSLNSTEHADRRQNAVNAAARALITARKAHSAALAKFNETSPTSADAEIVAGDLRTATRELSDTWKGFHDLAGNLN